ncbi:MAG: GAF domain-containing sensor histidine kinase [Chitinophagaceae bacterium]|nr:MAG: GAF domain-containing sensor histidine kinase [Chitinophagaceae bacterium]
MPSVIDPYVLAIKQIDAVADILQIVRKTTGMGFAAVAHVTKEKWLACAVNDGIGFGLKAGEELQLSTTICHEISMHRQPVIIDHVATDPAYQNHHTPAIYGFQSYISFPVFLNDGTFFGTLCAIDPNPAILSAPHVKDMFRIYAELIGHHLDKQQENTLLSDELFSEKSSGKLREQFIAIISHDLRNPLSTCITGAHLLAESLDKEEDKQLANSISRASMRMKGLLDDLMDFTQGKLGQGLSVNITRVENMGRDITAILEDHKITGAHPAGIVYNINFPDVAFIDKKRFAQLLSNLLGNAVNYGIKDQPIHVNLSTENDTIVLSVKNATLPIAPEDIKKFFEPYVRGEGNTVKGLGLGLFIASEIVKAHAGNISAGYADGFIEFTARLQYQPGVDTV